jgi:threonyl-tRNA synthetase
VTERHHAYAAQVGEALRAARVRVQVDDRNEKLGYKIREAQLQKIPYMLVVGDKEVEAQNVSVRHRQAGDLGSVDVQALAAKISSLSAERATLEEAGRAPGGVS